MLNAHQKTRSSRKGPTGMFATCKGVETDMSRSDHPEILPDSFKGNDQALLQLIPRDSIVLC